MLHPREKKKDPLSLWGRGAASASSSAARPASLESGAVPATDTTATRNAPTRTTTSTTTPQPPPPPPSPPPRPTTIMIGAVSVPGIRHRTATTTTAGSSSHERDGTDTAIPTTPVLLRPGQTRYYSRSPKCEHHPQDPHSHPRSQQHQPTRTQTTQTTTTTTADVGEEEDGDQDDDGDGDNGDDAVVHAHPVQGARASSARSPTAAAATPIIPGIKADVQRRERNNTQRQRQRQQQRDCPSIGPLPFGGSDGSRDKDDNQDKNRNEDGDHDAQQQQQHEQQHEQQQYQEQQAQGGAVDSAAEGDEQPDEQPDGGDGDDERRRRPLPPPPPSPPPASRAYDRYLAPGDAPVLAVARRIVDDDDEELGDGPSSPGAKTAATTNGKDRRDRGVLTSAVEYTPGQRDVEYETERSKRNRRSRRVRLYVGLILSALIALAIGLTVGMTRIAAPTTSSTSSSSPSSLDSSPPGGTNITMTEEEYRRASLIERYVVRAVGRRDVAGAPYAKALEWIVRHDPMRLSVPEDDHDPTSSPSPSSSSSSSHLLQRYIAAYFYFATTADGPWRSCNPVDLGDESPNRTRTNNTPSSPSPSPSPSCLWEQLDARDPETIDAQIFRQNVSSYRWLSNITECRWAGILCDAQQQIVRLDMAGMGLSGPFPTGIYNWPFLREIRFILGSLRGPLPKDLFANGRGDRLVYVDLAHNRFTGSIPDDWWPRARKLQHLNLHTNRLGGSLPGDVGNLRDAKTFLVGNNRLTGTLPTQFGAMGSLGWLDVSRNRLNGSLPGAAMANWTHIKILSLNKNRFIGSLPPDGIRALSNLRELRIDFNPSLTGPLPDSLFDITSLRYLDANDCALSGSVPSQIGRLGGSLYRLRLSNNQLRGPVPTELGLLTQLGQVWLQGNDFTGTVPAALCAIQGNEFADNLDDFVADCASDGAGYVELTCDCCTHCCRPDGTDCIPRNRKT